MAISLYAKSGIIFITEKLFDIRVQSMALDLRKSAFFWDIAKEDLQ